MGRIALTDEQRLDSFNNRWIEKDMGFITPCHIWTHSLRGKRKDREGYAFITIGKQAIQAHRYIYEIHHGKIPDGLQIDHLCKITYCVNPEHLETVTQSVNCKRAFQNIIRTHWNGIKTHCKNGHEFTPDNTYINPTSKARICRICNRSWNKERKVNQNGINKR